MLLYIIIKLSRNLTNFVNSPRIFHLLNMKSSNRHFIITLLTASLASADTCSSVEALGHINVTRPLNLAYIEEQTQYW